MKENPKNVEFRCSKHSRKPDRRWTKKPPDFFVGKFVKKGFLGINPYSENGDAGTEHMWVKITRVAGVALFGRLDNVPVFKMELRYGDEVRVLRKDIEQVFGDGKDLLP
jgi:hypothetical protein